MRKKPFSHKQKKKQLQEKRNRKKGVHDEDDNHHGDHPAEVPKVPLEKNNKEQKNGANKEAPLQIIRELYGLKTVFAREPDEVVAERKRNAHNAIERFAGRDLWETEDLHPVHIFGMPRRPPWDNSMSKEMLEKSEREAFANWITGVYKAANDASVELNFFEHNIDVWRQLWRAIEMGDVLLICCDVRWPTFTFPYALVEHAREVGKPVVLTLTKTDLVSSHVSKKWEEYFRKTFPQLFVVLTNAFPVLPEEEGEEASDRVKSKKGQRKKALKRNPESKEAILNACKEAVGWKGPTDDKPFFTISAVGAPNAGKSATINLLIEAHKVAVSATPGKTKHFQTLFINAECRLLDSPGLMFPSSTPNARTLQAIVGNYPLSQLREPFTAIAYLLKRIDLANIYGLQYPYDRDDSDDERPIDQAHHWASYEICEALAIKRGFSVKGGGYDVHRAGKMILSEALKGIIKPIYWCPPQQQARVE